ncbi:MAG TPA: D-sedoheptulose 7-phosphate isomerase [Gaiellaceae bacterium]
MERVTTDTSAAALADALAGHRTALATIESLSDDLGWAADLIARAFAADGRLLVCGNGGSAADAQHIAAEFVGRYLKDRAPYSAIALSTNTSAITAIGNDYGFDEVFARQVRAHGRAGDVLLAISTSGTSPNVLAAVAAAREAGMKVIALSGRDGGTLIDDCDVCLVVPVDSTPRIQEMHILLAHVLCGLVEDALS